MQLARRNVDFRRRLAAALATAGASSLPASDPEYLDALARRIAETFNQTFEVASRQVRQIAVSARPTNGHCDE
jgi:hypothetical protein